MKHKPKTSGIQGGNNQNTSLEIVVTIPYENPFRTIASSRLIIYFPESGGSNIHDDYLEYR